MRGVTAPRPRGHDDLQQRHTPTPPLILLSRVCAQQREDQDEHIHTAPPSTPAPTLNTPPVGT